MFEGLTSDIALDGSQPQSNGMRCDCVTESSAAFAVRSVVTGNASDAAVARSLLNFGHMHAGYHQPWAVGAGPPTSIPGAVTADGRPWVVSGDAFGLMSWTTHDGAYEEFYKDDDARGLLGAMATAGLLGSDRWHSTIATAVLGNLRATSRNGFGPSSADFKDMVGANFTEAEGWRKIFDSEGTPSFSPHYQAYIWAVYLLGYQHSGYAPLLERAQAALTIMMENYPSKWVPTANGIGMQRARIILPLAFLVRANDTALHRQWLITAVDGLLGRRHCENGTTTSAATPPPSLSSSPSSPSSPSSLPSSSSSPSSSPSSSSSSFSSSSAPLSSTYSWCAYKEELSHEGWGGSTRVPNNADYGTFEAPLNQHNDDPVSDFLYTSNFALLGLHEAAAALGNATIRAEEDKLAEYIVRLQVRELHSIVQFSVCASHIFTLRHKHVHRVYR